MILKEIATGKTIKKLRKLCFSAKERSCNYISKLLEKLELQDRTQLAIYYYQHFTVKTRRANLLLRVFSDFNLKCFLNYYSDWLG